MRKTPRRNEVRMELSTEGPPPSDVVPKKWQHRLLNLLDVPPGSWAKFGPYETLPWTAGVEQAAQELDITVEVVPRRSPDGGWLWVRIVDDHHCNPITNGKKEHDQ